MKDLPLSIAAGALPLFLVGASESTHQGGNIQRAPLRVMDRAPVHVRRSSTKSSFPVELVRLSLEIAKATDARVAALPPDRMWPEDPESPIYRVRAAHRGEHLDDVEAALRAR